MERAIVEATDGADYLNISFDIDSLDPAFAPGTSTPKNHDRTMTILLKDPEVKEFRVV
jgi:agmatinase